MLYSHVIYSGDRKGGELFEEAVFDFISPAGFGASNTSTGPNTTNKF